MSAEATQAKVRMCTRKVAFPTLTAAIGGCISSSRKFGHAMRPYPCPHCHKWHITSEV